MLLWDIQAESPALDHPMILLWLLCECAVSSLPRVLGGRQVYRSACAGGHGEQPGGEVMVKMV